MEQLPQLKLVVDSKEASERADVSLVGKVLSEKTLTENEVFMVVRRIWFTRELPKVEEISKTSSYSPLNQNMIGTGYGIDDHGQLTEHIYC